LENRGVLSSQLSLPSILYFYSNLVTNKFYTPASYAEAMASPHCTEWCCVTDTEMENLLQNGTWILVTCPQAHHLNEVHLHRYSQHFGEDFTETYTPMVIFENLCIVLTFACALDLEIHSMDVVLAFLHVDLTKEIYINQPKGYVYLT
jgi:hypothetical protein